MNLTLNDELLRKLAKAQGPCLTVAFRRNGSSESFETKLEQARKLLNGAPVDVAALLQPLIDSLDSTNTTGSTVLFRSPDLFEQVHTVTEVTESVTVADHFALGPWLSLKDTDREFSILALSLGRTRLLRCTSSTSEEMAFPAGTPTSLEEFMDTDRPDRRVDGVTGAMFGTSSDADARDEHVAHFFLHIDQAVRTLLNGSNVPLVVAAVDHERAAYMRINTYAHVVEPGISGAPDGLRGGEMHERALALLQDAVPEPVQKHLDNFDKMVGTGHASIHLQDILKAAREGRVSQLLMRTDAQPERRLDEAASETLRHGGAAFSLPAAKLPNGVLVAAIYRYAAV